MRVRAFVGVGSNILPHVHVPRALTRLRDHLDVVAVSTFYRTPALRRPADPDFWNGVVEVRTDLGPLELKALLRRIEDDLGRRRTTDAYAPRTIDLDVLVHGDRVLDDDVRTRPFVAVPLLELAPRLVLPDDEMPLRDVVAALPHMRLRPVDVPATTRAPREAGSA